MSDATEKEGWTKWDWLVVASATIAALAALTLLSGMMAYGFGWSPPETWRMPWLVGTLYAIMSVGAIAVPAIRAMEIGA